MRLTHNQFDWVGSADDIYKRKNKSLTVGELAADHQVLCQPMRGIFIGFLGKFNRIESTNIKAHIDNKVWK